MSTQPTPSSRQAVPFGRRFGLADDRRARSSSSPGSFRSPRRFSAQFGRTGWCSNLHQNRRHHPAHLAGRENVASSLPWAIEALSQAASQHQEILCSGNYQTPSLKLFWGADPHLCPEEILFEEAIGVLMGEAMFVDRNHFPQRKRRRPCPEKPTLARVASSLCCLWAHDAKDADLHFPAVAKGQVMPGLHHKRLALF